MEDLTNGESIQTIQPDSKAKVKDDNTKLITEKIKDNSVDTTRVNEKGEHTNTAIDANLTTQTRVGSLKTQLSSSTKEKDETKEKENSEVNEEKAKDKVEAKVKTTTEKDSTMKRTTQRPRTIVNMFLTLNHLNKSAMTKLLSYSRKT